MTTSFGAFALSQLNEGSGPSLSLIVGGTNSSLILVVRAVSGVTSGVIAGVVGVLGSSEEAVISRGMTEEYRILHTSSR